MKDAIVSVKYEELRAMEDQIAKLQADAALVDQRIQEATLKGEHAAEQYRNAFLAAFVIVQYALGHLDAMTFRGFPFQKLLDLAELLRTTPFLPPQIAELSGDLKLLSKEYRKWEDARAKGTEQQLLSEENARHHGVPFDDVDLPPGAP
jgi:hypothetical protein